MITLIQDYCDHGLIVYRQDNDYMMIDEHSNVIMKEPILLQQSTTDGFIYYITNMAFFGRVVQYMEQQDRALDEAKQLIQI